MTSPIGPFVGSSNPLSTSDPRVLDRDDFLQLLVTQLRHQDPLNPMDATQFSSQLAEFSGLEQLMQLNDGVSALSQGSALNQLALNTSLGSTLIGHTVLGFGDQIDITERGTQRVVADIAGSGGSGVIKIFDLQGTEVYSRPVGAVPGGPQRSIEFELDTDLPPGQYLYQLTVTDAEGGNVPVEQYVSGVVRGVFFNEAGIVLRVGSHLRISLDNLAEIEPQFADSTEG